MINWQLSKQGFRWPVSSDRIPGSVVEVEYFLKLSTDKLLVFKWSQAQVYFFKKSIWNMLCLCHYDPVLSRFWFQTDLGRENSASCLKIQAGKTFLTMVTFYVQFLCSDWSKFERWVHAASWNLFTSTCLLRLVCLLGFWLRNASLIKVGNPISDGIVFLFLPCSKRKRV